MSKMGNEQGKINENKYAMWEFCKELLEAINLDKERIGVGRLENLEQIVNRIENNKGGE
uniref:Uncharacterized protein n=1 Tax=viral metagenome TaxID=1070528 RepID=A0A6M3IGM9_9ZZZZ